MTAQAPRFWPYWSAFGTLGSEVAQCRFSIRTLMAVIVVSAVGLAGLRNANELWAGMLLIVALAAIGISVLGILMLRGKDQVLCVGFALFSASISR